MRRFVFFLVTLLSSTVPVFCKGEPLPQKKFYLLPEQIAMSKQLLHVYLMDMWYEIDVIRVDTEGTYVLEQDLMTYAASRGSKRWQCPYCRYWWQIGESCKNPRCPTNNW